MTIATEIQTASPERELPTTPSIATSKSTRGTHQSSPEAELKISDEDDHSWEGGQLTDWLQTSRVAHASKANSKTSHIRPMRNDVSPTGKGLQDSSGASTDPSKHKQHGGTLQPQESLTTPSLVVPRMPTAVARSPLRLSSNAGSRPKDPNSMSTMQSSSIVVEARNPPSQRSEDTYLLKQKRGSERGRIGTKHEVSGAIGKPTPVPRTPGTEPTGPAGGNGKPPPSRSNTFAGGMYPTSPNSGDSQVKPSRSSEEPSSRPPIDKHKTTTRSSSPSFIPRNPKDNSPKRRVRTNSSASAHLSRECGVSVSSNKSARSTPLPPQEKVNSNSMEWNGQWMSRTDPDFNQEQALFEQRLCQDTFGVAVRKINQNGRSTLRYVKCVPLDMDADGSVSNRSLSNRSLSNRSISNRSVSNKSVSNKSVSSRRSRLSSRRGRDQIRDLSEPRSSDLESLRNLIGDSDTPHKTKRALIWGKKKECKLPLSRFVSIRKGKTTERTRKNPNSASRLLSIITDVAEHASLDIEAPTKLDRDKFAKAFARFLEVPLEEETEQNGDALVHSHLNSNVLEGNKQTIQKDGTVKSSKHVISTPGKKDHQQAQRASPVVLAAASASVGKRLNMDVDSCSPSSKPPLSSPSLIAIAPQTAAALQPSQNEVKDGQQLTSKQASNQAFITTSRVRASSNPSSGNAEPEEDNDDGTVVSSLTGAGFDQEIVEELHNALTELKRELVESRAEAARAVKVAEQAIQSAERTNTGDWNSTVTHKAAEAAALAQKRSAGAIAKQRLAEDRLSGERKTAAFWRKQAEAAEEEAGALQTRAAAAEVQRAAVAEVLDSERRNAASIVTLLKGRYASTEVHQKEALENAMDRNRSLEIELDGTRRDLLSKEDEAKTLQESLLDMSSTEIIRNGRKKKGFRKKKSNHDTISSIASASLLSSHLTDLSIRTSPRESTLLDPATSDTVSKLHMDALAVRQQFEILRRVTADELRALPMASTEWASQVSDTFNASQSEISRLREKLALESSTRRKLLHEVQDLRGITRVYCRPRACHQPGTSKGKGNAKMTGIVSLPSQDTLLLHRERVLPKGATEGAASTRPLSFEFDRVFDPDLKQNEVYAEVEEVMLGVLDGYKVCVMAFGATGTGKTHTIFGDIKNVHEGMDIDIENHGIQLQAVKQLFDVAEHRNARYQDTFSFSIAEVHNERLCDLIAGTDIGETRGQIFMDDTQNGSKKGGKGHFRGNTEDDLSTFSQQCTSASSKTGKQNKLEIRSNKDGDTVVQGLLSVPVTDFEEVLQLWQECLNQRACRFVEQGLDQSEYEASSHIIATLNVVSTNIATGVCNIGRINFADLAGADLTSRKPPVNNSKSTSSDALMAPVGNKLEWKFSNKSMTTLNDVVNARCQFLQTVPYRNSTVTHLLRDSIEADTKVIMMVCVSSDPEDLQETAVALKFASKMRKVSIGKATKHTLNDA